MEQFIKDIEKQKEQYFFQEQELLEEYIDIVFDYFDIFIKKRVNTEKEKEKVKKKKFQIDVLQGINVIYFNDNSVIFFSQVIQNMDKIQKILKEKKTFENVMILNQENKGLQKFFTQSKKQNNSFVQWCKQQKINCFILNMQDVLLDYFNKESVYYVHDVYKLQDDVKEKIKDLTNLNEVGFCKVYQNDFFAQITSSTIDDIVCFYQLKDDGIQQQLRIVTI